MIFNMVGGGGTGGASIFIVNSVNQRPTNVFSNTLWVNTGVDVVKYVFSDNEPSNPTEGMLWLTISNSDNVNVVAPINKDWMKFNLGIVKQYIDGVWERKVAQLYKDGIWVDVGRMFSASINITYPANSTCVVTNSGGQTVASDTNATSSEKTFTATVNAIGTYTVTATATDGSGNIKSESVEITSEGQSESVDLHYIFYIFKSGVGAKVELQTFEQANANVTIGTDSIKITRIDAGNNYSNIQTKELMPSALWNTIKIDVILTKVSSYENSNAFGLAKSALSSQGDFDWVVYTTLADKAGTERVVLSCDIVAINADYIFGIGGSFNMEIFNIWLE